ncbi:hypothetical protein EBBID32_1060 [Sphingobium indicum BiD32]|uniref:ParB/Sulfiredoxin domain-containing protein n=1 Tax=Sphingobium indicum BiD32 TaxID=1301087 RepID=N1MK42_9SPHN|nr:DUF6551 family protein [Sphingobium indicum]CCW15778.1 hypothetical protein EBBID32_1060 [Sphingobium indicum BiD32]
MRGASYPTTTPPSHIWVYQPSSAMPEWVAAKKADAVQPNGTFLIHSEMGQARVHPGNVIFEYKGNIYACQPSEVQRTLQEMEDRFAPDPKVIARVVPQSAAKLASESAPSPKKTAASVGRVAKSQSSPRKWPAAKGNPPSVENRHPSELNLDDSYQRSTENGASQALIKKIAAGWDWRMCLPLVVSKRDDGSLWVIDGQHRLAAAMLRGDIPFLPCCVGVYGSVADEAAMFVAMNRARKPMNRLDDFHAAIASGDSEAIEIADIIKGAGFTVSRKTGSQSWVPGEVAFTSAIAKVLRKHGAKVCADALHIMHEAWPDEVLNAGSSMFTALTKLAINPPADFDPDRMFHALLKRDQREWASFLNETKGGGGDRALALRHVLLMAYDEEPEVKGD